MSIVLPADLCASVQSVHCQFTWGPSQHVLVQPAIGLFQERRTCQ
jgi:hypothetical protein